MSFTLRIECSLILVLINVFLELPKVLIQIRYIYTLCIRVSNWRFGKLKCWKVRLRKGEMMLQSDLCVCGSRLWV